MTPKQSNKIEELVVQLKRYIDDQIQELHKDIASNFCLTFAMHKINLINELKSLTDNDIYTIAQQIITVPKNQEEAYIDIVDRAILTYINNPRGKDMNKKKKVVFDVDDILWALNKRMTEMAGIDFSKLTVYSVLENKNLTDDERQRAYNIYMNHELFENIEWYPGIERINQLDADISINSNSFCDKASMLKRQQLHDVLTLPDEKIIIRTITDEKKKEMDDDIFIFIDDSPYNIAASKATYNIVLQQPWNSSPEMQAIMRTNGTGYIYCDTLEHIIDLVEMLITGKKKEWS